MRNLVFGSIACILLSSCAPNLGKSIESPESIPTTASTNAPRARLGSYTSIAEVSDQREIADNEEDFTQPLGDVKQVVENGIKEAFREAGIAVIEDAPLALKTEIKKWRSNIKSKVNTTVTSEASLLVTLTDPSGKKIFTGTYNGNRNSEFPVVNREDVKDSLSLAMSQAISQMLSDKQLLEILGSY